MDSDTIAAIATPVALGGIGIIRISGTKSIDVAARLFHKGSLKLIEGSSAPPLVSHRMTHGYICDPVSNATIDEVFCVLMVAPNSYTREDVLEIHSHSGMAILSKILSLVLSSGARLAEPGEFTRRAFLNGRIDLSQAEAVADMITAKSETSLIMAARQLNGQTKSFVENILLELNQIIAEIQADIEFSDEVEDDSWERHNRIDFVAVLIAPLERLVQNHHYGHWFRDGIKLGIVGRPNVGKSSLLNRLLDNDRAIVTQFPGTTRDLVEDFFSVRGIPVSITDTAGLHLSDDPIEQVGMEKTKAYLSRSDMVLLVMDALNPYSAEDYSVLQQIPKQPVILVVNKIDLTICGEDDLVPDAFMNYPRVRVSARNGEGLETLKTLLAEQCLTSNDIFSENEIVPNLRQKKSFEAALNDFRSALQGYAEGLSEDLIVCDLESARERLKGIIGDISDNSVLDDIFSRFCIGK